MVEAEYDLSFPQLASRSFALRMAWCVPPQKATGSSELRGFVSVASKMTKVTSDLKCLKLRKRSRALIPISYLAVSGFSLDFK